MRIVMTHGVFDLLHPGHLFHLAQSRAMGDQLIVSVTADEHVNKGEGRPVFNVDQRMAMLRMMRCVDFVICSDWPTPENVIRYVRPHIYTKHKEYEGKLPEKALIEELGGKVVFTDWKEFSSSDLYSKNLKDYL